MAAVRLRTNRAFIGGEFIKRATSSIVSLKDTPVEDPGTRRAIDHVQTCGAHEATLAVDAASAALVDPSWKNMLPAQRSKILRKIATLHRENIDELATILASESGKPLAEASGEILYGASYFDWFAEESRRAYGQTIPSTSADRSLRTVHKPVGVCGLITPFNFPNAMLSRKLAAALAAGCTAVCKPSHDVPLSALALGKMCELAGVPDGVVNVLPSSRESGIDIGGVLTSDERVRKISFTGSTAVGAQLLAQSAPSIKRMSMELGGNAPFIVFDDAVVDQAVDGFMAAKYRNAGQTCISPNRLFVQKGVRDEFLAKLATRIQELKLGHFTDPTANVGPLINDAACAKVERLMRDSAEKGCSQMTDADDAARHRPHEGYVLPHLMVCENEYSDAYEVAQTEIFGPLTVAFPFDDLEDVLNKANATEVGLASYVFSRDVGTIERTMDGLEYGMCGVNTGVISTEVAPFGGVKRSGLGREGGAAGIHDYLDTQYRAVCY